MKLDNPFSLETRWLYHGVWGCWLCGQNGWNRGGLELHHILGRESSSAFNSALLCGSCHKGMVHNEAEHQQLFTLTVRYLLSIGYKPSEADWEFLRDNYRRLVDNKTHIWLTKKFTSA